MRLWPTVSATVMSAVLLVLVLFGCLLGGVNLAPSEPCAGDPDPGSGWWIRPALALFGLLAALTAVASIVVAWVGVTNSGRSPRPHLIAAASGMLLSAAMSGTIMVVIRVAGDC